MDLGAAHLTVSRLDHSVAFYQDVVGLSVRRRDDHSAVLGAGEEDVLVLVEEPGARPAGRHAGLYHVALLFPTREELARALQRIAVTRTPIQGASDHGVSEAIYLPDPDGNGLELYADRPREQWPAPGPGERVGMYTHPLDLEGLLGLVAADAPRPRAADGLRVGHVHLHVSDLEAAVGFYVRELGLEEMTRYPGAAFLSWNGYHHHLGLNTWRGTGIPAAPAPGSGVAGMRRMTVIGGGPRTLTDPSGNAIAVVPAAAPLAA
ncbi:MAG: VOC family protein [Solirubrobacteraceae bacterium]|nr:VOC family protein [Solirubrobacteraceae bacterium]